MHIRDKNDRIVFFFDGTNIRIGSSWGRKVYEIDGSYIRDFDSKQILFNIDSPWIREGQSSWGSRRYEIRGNKIFDDRGSLKYKLE